MTDGMTERITERMTDKITDKMSVRITDRETGRERQTVAIESGARTKDDTRRTHKEYEQAETSLYSHLSISIHPLHRRRAPSIN